MSDTKPVLDQVDADIDNALERLFSLLRIPSISTDPAYADDCIACADHLVADLNSIGFDASRRKTIGLPMVVAHGGPKPGTGAGPHILFYGHYDVQPPDPLEKWTSGPFEPVVKEGANGKQIVARGSSDDKGQLMTFIEAARAYMAVHGELPIPVTILLEGEEESGSKSVGPFFAENKDELNADVALVCDTGMWDADTPAISTRLRGLVHDEVFITGPSRDLHSGHYGGAAMNPIRVLAKVIASLHDENGRITVPGFYEGVKDLEPEIRAQWDGLGFDEKAFLGDVGLSIPSGEKGRSALELLWAQPTIEVNGINGGYTGVGSKTVIPSLASAKFTFRLVGEQDPAKLLEAFRAHVRALIPADCKVEFSADGGGSPALELPLDSPHLSAAREALKAEWDKDAVLIGMGGSIPIVGDFKRALGMDTLLVGFALEDDAIHSPNEKYNLKSFHKGIRSWVRIIDELAKG
ncbi:M20/M25/M40 family metallo-hydrolase [Tepidamorphus sp. 3E244]|uniref:M20/M25/M40 family metallo-hydrolase n=1 Tax=Tepidamorphus sp. 3E244 TaxID=3385498 RepID=UPI0038FCC2AB